MGHSTPPEPSVRDEFDVAKLIHDALEGLDRQQQARAIRFASESLGVPLTTDTRIPESPAGPARSQNDDEWRPNSQVRANPKDMR